MAALARRLITILTATTVLVISLAPSASAVAHEDELLSLLNAARTANGLAPVTMHSDLVDDARYWSQHMRDQGELSHNPSLAAVTTGWAKLGENVGVGPTAESLHEAFMASAGHRRNVLGDYDRVGIAVAPKPQPHLYNAWFQEIYMETPETNPDGYRRSAPINFAEGLQGDLLIIHGTGGEPLSGKTDEPVTTHLDHRIAMSMAVAGLASRNGVEVDDTSPIQTSFPNFMNLLSEATS